VVRRAAAREALLRRQVQPRGVLVALLRAAPRTARDRTRQRSQHRPRPPAPRAPQRAAHALTASAAATLVARTHACSPRC
jgi:hypothetical protein